MYHEYYKMEEHTISCCFYVYYSVINLENNSALVTLISMKFYISNFIIPCSFAEFSVKLKREILILQGDVVVYWNKFRHEFSKRNVGMISYAVDSWKNILAEFCGYKASGMMEYLSLWWISLGLFQPCDVILYILQPQQNDLAGKFDEQSYRR